MVAPDRPTRPANPILAGISRPPIPYASKPSPDLTHRPSRSRQPSNRTEQALSARRAASLPRPSTAIRTRPRGSTTPQDPHRPRHSAHGSHREPAHDRPTQAPKSHPVLPPRPGPHRCGSVHYPPAWSNWPHRTSQLPGASSADRSTTAHQKGPRTAPAPGMPGFVTRLGAGTTERTWGRSPAASDDTRDMPPAGHRVERASRPGEEVKTRWAVRRVSGPPTARGRTRQTAVRTTNPPTTRGRTGQTAVRTTRPPREQQVRHRADDPSTTEEQVTPPCGTTRPPSEKDRSDHRAGGAAHREGGGLAGAAGVCAVEADRRGAARRERRVPRQRSRGHRLAGL